MTFRYEIADVAPYINWGYFYFAWQVKQKAEQERLREEAEHFLKTLEGKYRSYGLVQIVDVHAEEDDIMVCSSQPVEDTQEEVRLPMLRQQNGSPCLCLSDFIHPVKDKLGLFATSVDQGMEHDFDDDPYQKMMAQLLADRLAEATAERLHEQVRKELWGYAPDEQLSIPEMQQEHFQGIRPAVGYPSLPDASINFLLDQLLHLGRIGITLTESGAMRPHASVSGLMIAHPKAHYFNVGKIDQDQLSDYARRRALPIDTVKRFLSANL